MRDPLPCHRAALGAITLTCLHAGAATASDYGALYFLFLELPVLAASCAFFALCFAAPKTGAVLCGLLFVATFGLIVFWAGRELPSLAITLLIDIAGIAVAVRQMRVADARRDSAPERDGQP